MKKLIVIIITLTIIIAAYFIFKDDDSSDSLIIPPPPPINEAPYLTNMPDYFKIDEDVERRVPLEKLVDDDGGFENLTRSVESLNPHIDAWIEGNDLVIKTKKNYDKDGQIKLEFKDKYDEIASKIIDVFVKPVHDEMELHDFSMKQNEISHNLYDYVIGAESFEDDIPIDTITLKIGNYSKEWSKADWDDDYRVNLSGSINLSKESNLTEGTYIAHLEIKDKDGNIIKGVESGIQIEKEDAVVEPIIKVTGPWINERNQDQVLIGGYTDGDGELYHIFYDPGGGPSIYKYKNSTDEIVDSLISDPEFRGYDLFRKDLWVYHTFEIGGGIGRSHKITHIDVETGERDELVSHDVYGTDKDEDQFIIVGSAGETSEGESGLFLFIYPENGDPPNEHPTEWALRYYTTDGYRENVDLDVRLEDIALGDTSNKNGVGYLTEEGELNLYERIGNTHDFNKVLEETDIIDFSLLDKDIAIVKEDGVYVSTWANLNTLTFVEGTEGAIEVDIDKDTLIVQTDKALLLFKEGEKPYELYNKDKFDYLWLEALEEIEDTLRIVGNIDNNTANLDVWLNAEKSKAEA